MLEEKGILEGTLAPKLYLRFVDRTLQPEAGAYQFPSPISAREVLRQLENGTRRAFGPKEEVLKDVLKNYQDVSARPPAAAKGTKA